MKKTFLQNTKMGRAGRQFAGNRKHIQHFNWEPLMENTA
jgi:hypothetical protein